MKIENISRIAYNHALRSDMHLLLSQHRHFLSHPQRSNNTTEKRMLRTPCYVITVNRGF